MKGNKPLYISFALGLIACIIVVFLRLFSIADLWFQMFAAILGVIITAIITQVLLKGQTENDSERERSSEVFREKLKIYMDFLRMLCDTLKDKRLTEEEAMQMQFQMSYIAMHTKSENIEQISKSVKAIVEAYTTHGHKPTSKQLLPQLFNIVACFRTELYPSQQIEFTCDVFNEQINKAMGYLEVFDERKYVAVASVYGYESVSNMLKERGWNVTEGQDGNGCLRLELTNKDKAGRLMRLFINPITDMGATKYAIGLQYKGTDIYDMLKKRYQGNIVDGKDGYWWKYLDEEYANLGSELYERLQTDGEAQQSVLGMLMALEQYISNYATLHPIRQYLSTKVPDNWNVNQHYDDILFCELKKTEKEEEGRTYIDIKLNKDGKTAIFEIGIRGKQEQKAEKLEATIKRTGIRVKNGRICADYENVRISDLPENALQIIQIIDGK